MGRRLSASEETELLRETVRAAHEATQDLRAAIREALALVPTLVAEFEAHHHAEMSQLSNHMTQEGNRAAAELNASVAVARAEIVRQLTVAEFKYNMATGHIRLGFSDGKFDDQIPPPFPQFPAKETSQ